MAVLPLLFQWYEKFSIASQIVRILLETVIIIIIIITFI